MPWTVGVFLRVHHLSLCLGVSDTIKRRSVYKSMVDVLSPIHRSCPITPHKPASVPPPIP